MFKVLDGISSQYMQKHLLILAYVDCSICKNKFLFYHKSHMLWVSKEQSQRDCSFEHSMHMPKLLDLSGLNLSGLQIRVRI